MWLSYGKENICHFGLYTVHNHLGSGMSATTENTVKSLLAERQVFTNFYIHATGLLEYGNIMVKSFFSGQINNHAFALYWLIGWDDFNTTFPTTVTIYSEKDGQVLWTNEGQDGIWELKLFFYKGTYTTLSTPDDRLVIHLDGNAKASITLTGS